MWNFCSGEIYIVLYVLNRNYNVQTPEARLLSVLIVNKVTHGHISSSSSLEVAKPRSLLSVTTFRGSVHRDIASALHLLASTPPAVVREPNKNRWWEKYFLKLFLTDDEDGNFDEFSVLHCVLICNITKRHLWTTLKTSDVPVNIIWESAELRASWSFATKVREFALKCLYVV